MSKLSEVELLRLEVSKLKAENAELSAKVWLFEKDAQVLGQENHRLTNGYNAARAEIARLTAPKEKGKRGRPKKTVGSYESYLVRETMEIITESMRNGGERMSELDASVLADERIRKTAKALQSCGMGGAFVGVCPNYPSEGREDAIYTAFRRGKKNQGWT